MESSAGRPRPTQSYFGQWYFAALLAAILLTIPGLGEKRFYTRGEPREALVIDQMFRTGNFILPHGYGGAVPSKPPMMHWLATLLSYPGGAVTELTTRLPSALASILFVAYFFPFIAKRTSIYRGLIASVLLVSSFEWWRTATAARVDMLLSVLLAVGLLELYRWRERDLKGLPLCAIAAFSGATLTKGPISLVLPGMIFGVYLLLTEIPFFKATVKTVMVLLLSCLIPFVWYWAAYQSDPVEFWAKFYSENIARFLGAMDDDAHKHSAGYMLGTLGYGLMPWIVSSFTAGIIALFARIRFTSIKGALQRIHPLDLFSIVSSIMIVLFFCIPSSKRSVYLLPAYPFMTILLSLLFEAGAEFRSRRIEQISALLLAAIILIVSFAAAMILSVPALPEMAARFLPPALTPIFLGGVKASPVVGTVLILGIVFLASGAVLIRAARDRPIGFGAVVMWILFLSAANIVMTPFANQLGNNRFADQVRPVIKAEPNVKLYSYGQQFFGASFYLQKPIDYFDLKHPQPGLVLTSTDEVEAVIASLPSDLKSERVIDSTFADTKPDLFPVLLRVFAAAGMPDFQDSKITVKSEKPPVTK